MPEGEEFHLDFCLGNLEIRLRDIHKEISETKEYEIQLLEELTIKFSQEL